MGGYWGKVTKGEYCVDNESEAILPSLIINGNVSGLQEMMQFTRPVFEFHDGTTLLHMAALHQQKECLRYLLNKQVVPVNKTDYSNETALNAALIQSETFECADLLIGAGVDLNLKNKWQRTPLLKAAIDHNEEVVSYLLEKGANPNVEDCMGCTPLNQAAFYKLHTAFEKLLQHSADIHFCNKNGQTALYFACKSLNKMAVIILINRGSDVGTDVIKTVLTYFESEKNLHKRMKIESILRVLISALAETISFKEFLRTIFLRTQFNVSQYLLACTDRVGITKYNPAVLAEYFKSKPHLLSKCCQVRSLKDLSRLVVRSCLASSGGNVIYSCKALNIPPGLKSVILFHDIS